MPKINNTFYDDLKEEWHTAHNHPIALLRAENSLRNPWIETHLRPLSNVLDIGCGAGLLTNFLSEKKHIVTGIDLSPSSLEEARKKDRTEKVDYLLADATSLPFEDGVFDAVMAMDFLEHVEDPRRIISEASRVLKKGGLFFFHTFNRNFWSYLLVIKGVEWAVKNTPKNMHVYSLFITPTELEEMCHHENLHVEQWIGIRPKWNKAFWKMVFSRTVPEDFTFEFTSSLSTGYSGIAKKILS